MPWTYASPESFLTNTVKVEYNARIMLTEVLEQRTGSQGWFTISEDAYDIHGHLVSDCKALHAHSSRARKLYEHVSHTPELEVLKAIVGFSTGEPKMDNCSDWDDQTKRRLTALYWTKETERFESHGSSYWDKSLKEARAKARNALNGVTEHKCSCGHTHEHTEGPRLSVPTPADVRSLIEAVVDKHLVSFLLAN